jgi:hypothetical protein
MIKSVYETSAILREKDRKKRERHHVKIPENIEEIFGNVKFG